MALALLSGLAGARAPSAAEPQEAPFSPAQERLFEQIRGNLEQRLEHFHISPQSIDQNVLLEEVANRIDAGESEPAILAWLGEEIPKRLLRFAPIDPDVQLHRKYALPFDRRVHWIVSQELSSNESHRGYNEFAIDFAMPEGTEVWAARAGTVARVVDGFTECALPEDREYAANGVTVLHDDGSFTSYLHLRPGIPVGEGQPVALGDLLGYSGCTGHAATPHLHFQVSARRSATRVHSIPFRFEDGTPEGYVPKIWSLYQNRPPATARLRVSVAGSELASGRPFPVADPGSAQLRVEVARADGDLRDVTRDPGTRYVALTPWSLAVDAAGRVVFGRSKPWAPFPDDVERGFVIVAILYRGADGREGFFDAWLTLPDATVEAPPRRVR